MMLCALIPIMALGFVQVQPIEVSGEAGFGGMYRPGEWTPVVLDLHNPGDTRDLLVILCWASTGQWQDAIPSAGSLTGRSGPFHHVRVSLPKESRKRLHAALPAPGPDLSLWAFVCRPDGTRLAHRELAAAALKPHERMIAVAGARPPGLDLPQLKIAQVDPFTLPEDWRGYSSIDALVWSRADPNLFHSSAQLEALRKWISCGGRWIIDRSSIDMLLQSPLADLVPVAPGPAREVRDLETLGLLMGADLKGPVPIMEVTPRRGTNLAWHGELPLIVDALQDGGRVTFLAFDPNLDPFSEAETGASFWKWLLAWVPPRQETRPSSAVTTAVGSKDMLSLLASFPGVAVPELRRLFLFIFIFLAVAGPLDYLVLRRLRRLRLTWITFPSYIVILSVSIVVSGAGFMRNLVMQREIAVVDHYERSKVLRRRALEAILTPSDMKLSMEGALPLTSDFLIRGPATSISDLSDLTIEWDRGMRCREWVIRRGATAMAQADDCFESPSRLTWTVEASDSPEVAIVVRNETGLELSRATLYTPDGLYSLGDLPAGERKLARVPVSRPDPPSSSNQEDHYSGQIQILFEDSTFPARGAPSVTGFAKDLDASRWIKAGNSVLLAWGRKLDPPVSFNPPPAHKRSLVLHRFFQEGRP